jgi:DMSO/TMAO reductase YedYZ molybdopterin-dependent catalytic subunit
MTEFIRMRRRTFLGGTAGALVAGVVGPGEFAFAEDAKELPDYVDWKNPDAMIVHSKNTLETRRDFIGTSGITANDELYVRNNLPAPDDSIVSDRDAWEVAIEGVVNPRTMTVGELKTLGLETVATVLQCSGNGRGFFDHEASGAPWETGAAGCVLWSGVPVRAVVEALGGAGKDMKFMTSTGGEKLPEGIDAKDVVVERSVPLEAALDTAILAWEMNGEPIPLAHGGPLRIVIPGYYGVNNVKYVKTLALTAVETDAKIQASGYRLRPIGVEGAPDQPSMWEMKVKSWVTGPLKDVKTGKVQIHGVAFGGVNAVKSVEVSTDGGKSWKEARLVGPDLGRYAWRPFVLGTDLKPGTYSVTSRATDMDGNVQEEITEPNHRAYDYSGWQRLAVDLDVG